MQLQMDETANVSPCATDDNCALQAANNYQNYLDSPSKQMPLLSKKMRSRWDMQYWDKWYNKMERYYY